MPLQSTSGAATYDAFGGGVAAVPNYIEEVFSTHLYTGNSSTQTITNGIDLAGEGGLVWIKWRSGVAGSADNALYDTNRGVEKTLFSNLTAAQATNTGLTAFNTTGFTLGSGGTENSNTANYASWTFRKQPKFFDVVTYTGNSTNRTIAHNLGSVPGCIIVKVTNTSDNWQVYHRANTNAPATDYLVLNSTNATVDDDTRWNDTLPTSTTFSLGTSSAVNGSGNTYVAYIFAHDAGGFGLTGTDNVISCGHYTSTDGSPITVTLGYEPQWILVKSTGNSSANWNMFDVMRGWPVSSAGQQLRANTSAAETSETAFSPTATGFIVGAGSNQEYNESGGYRYIYIAIRRGPMKVPTSGTSVFSPVARTGTGANATIASGFTTDLQIVKSTSQPYNNAWFDRLRGTGIALFSDSTVADQNYGAVLNFQSNTAVNISSETLINQSGQTFANFSFRRAPGFFDEVCFNGPTSGSTTQTHNLSVVPELMIVKPRSVGSYWYVYSSVLGISKYLALNLNDAEATSSNFWVTAPTSTAFTCSVDNMGSSGAIRPHVAYLFATCAGVSKVGSYTGTGTTLQINCGFTGGARLVMIKRTDSTGDWYVWDTARGIIAGNDPYLLLNSTAAEVTSTDYIDPYSLGFEISSTAPAAINANGGSFIFLAIA